MLIFPFALIILLAGIAPWVAVLKLPNKAAWLLAIYVIGTANVILTGYIANSFLLLNNRWIMLMIHLALGGIGWLVWKQAGQPSVWGSFKDWKPKLNIEWLRSEPVLSLLALSIVLFYGFSLAQVILIPQNNSDSLVVHLSRIGYWRQHGSFFPWPTFMLDQVWYPVNAQLQTYWTLLFLGNDQLVGAVQWLAALVSGIGVFGMARFYNYNFRQSAFAALIFLSFPLVALQSTTTQTDLVTAASFVSAVYFLFIGLRDRSNPLLTLSAISIGIGIGVKKSYFLLLPVLAVIAILALLQFGKHGYKQLIFWSFNIIIAISLFGAYGYIVNWQNWGGPFGPPAYIDNLLETSQNQQETASATERMLRHRSQNFERSAADPGSDIFLELVFNTPRLLYQAFDTSGLPRPLDGYAHKVKMRLAQPFFQWIGFEEIEGTAYTATGHTFSFADKNINEESHAWYGPLSVLLIFPALIIQTRRGIKEHKYLLFVPGIALLVFLPMEIVLRPGWDPFQGRYFAPLVALSAPFMSLWFREKGGSISEWLISGLAIVIVAVTMLYNPSKPTLGKFADEFHVWDNDRIFVQTIQRKDDRDMYYMVEKFVPARSTLGYYIPFFILDYPLFGENLNRRLIPVISPSQISDIEWLREQGVDYLLLPRLDGTPLPPSEYQPIGKLSTWILYEYKPAP